MERKRIRDFSIAPGVMKTGPKSKITGVPDVLIGHETVRSGDNRTDITVIIPGPGNVFECKFITAGYVHNEFGKTYGLVQVGELGTLETPIALTNTLDMRLAADALVEYTIRQHEKGQVGVTSVSLVAGKCNDCRVNRIQHRAVSIEDVMEIFSGVDEDFEEGDMDAGTGTVCHGLRGGIGFVSKVMRIGEISYTLGALVQSNFEATEDLATDGIQADQRILRERERRKKTATVEQNQGSTMIIITIDLPINDHQLRHIIRRAGVGITRTGAYTGHGSGKVMIGFTTVDRLQGEDSLEIMTSICIREDLINVAFKTAAGAVNEAILNPVAVAGRTGGLTGEVYYSLSEFLPQILKH